MTRLRSFVVGFVFAALGIVLGAQVTKFPASGANQDLNTTSNVEFAAVTTHSVTAPTTDRDLQITAGTSELFSGGTINLDGGKSLAPSTSFGAQIDISGGAPDGEGGSLGLFGGETGVAGAAAGQVNIFGGTATPSPDANRAGGSITIRAGLGKGSIDLASIVFEAPVPGVSQVPAEVFRVDHLGAMFSKVYTTAPAAGDCDNAAETGRFAWDSTNNIAWLCSGASGWRQIATAAP